MPAPLPILSAVYKSDRAALERLLGGGTTPTLCEAAAMGDAARVRAQARAEPTALGGRSPDGWPPRHMAAFHDDVEIVHTLLAHGAAADARDDDGKTPLALAEDQGQALVARRLRGEIP